MSVFESESAATYRFGPFVFVPERQSLMRGNEAVRIGGRALDILTLLVERAGEAVGKAELMQHVWPNLIVDEGNLKVNMAALRRALATVGHGVFIETVPGKGYKFVEEVKVGHGVATALPPTRVSHLPTVPRVFGRSREIEALLAALARGRLISIVGTGGIGKTTVALAVAERSINDFRDGVVLVDFARLRGPDLVANAIAMAMAIEVHSADVLTSICRHIHKQEILIVLDNCEHLTDTIAACAARILEVAPAARLLTTSREPLNMLGEDIHHLSGLATPTSSNILTAAQAMKFPAIQLFADRAAERVEDFKLSDADASIVADICRGLDGIALAIELAAMRIDVFGVRGLHSQIEDRLHLLAGRRGGLERHRTLSATLDWSYSLLPPSDAQMLRAVSVFAGLFNVSGGCAVSGMPTSVTTQALSRLAAKSLLVIEHNANGIVYRLLQTTRAYCLERLRSDGEEWLSRQRHAEYVLSILDDASRDWAISADQEWGAAHWNVVDELRNALHWAAQTEGAAILQIKLVTAGLLLWNHFSLTEECRSQVELAIGKLDMAHLSGSAYEMQLKIWLGSTTMFTRGLLPETIHALQQALAIAKDLDDTESILRCLRNLGTHHLFTADYIDGLAFLEKFAAVATERDKTAIPDNESHIAIGELFLGRLLDTRNRLERLRVIEIHHSNPSPQLRYHSNRSVDVCCVLSQVQWLTGSPEIASDLANGAIERARASNHHLSLTSALSYACPVFFWIGDIESCTLCLELLQSIVDRHGFDVRKPVPMFYRAAVTCLRDNSSETGLYELERAIGHFRAKGHLARMPYYLGVQAEFLAKSGQTNRAEEKIGTALKHAHIQGEMWCFAELLRIKASIRMSMGRTAEAEALLARSIVVARDAGALSWQLRSATDLARLQASEARHHEAFDTLAPVVRAFTEGAWTRDHLAANRLLERLVDCQDGDRTIRTMDRTRLAE
ncbi:winged helix-turn-helix domain-containing protein [Rhizobium sp. CECT 9324]|uniref:ATP-binding protein n=1 Tax=Rhizobium sp. CECT 9324 TaxID=2845820 RepID=UPI001E462C6C|nr:winged helix-turn-helix domain-containing protein [Rhizobium sp. CECT 9324]CAH0340896.1 hypothetical protein RHI9324_02578 [Rhizobium sp. CECT 9324]